MTTQRLIKIDSSPSTFQTTEVKLGFNQIFNASLEICSNKRVLVIRSSERFLSRKLIKKLKCHKENKEDLLLEVFLILILCVSYEFQISIFTGLSGKWRIKLFSMYRLPFL